MENTMSLNALLRLVGLDGLNPASSNNPLPVSVLSNSTATSAVLSATNDSTLENITAVSAAGKLTIPAVAEKTIVVTSLFVEIFSTVARTASGTKLNITATGMAFTNTKALPTNATTIGTVEVVDVLDGQSMRANGTNTAIVVTVPSVTGMIYRTRATFTYI